MSYLSNLRSNCCQTIKGFKFGILYAKEGQTKEDEMFANIDSSPQFEEFLDFIGERVELDNWPRFRGGLDVKCTQYSFR